MDFYCFHHEIALGEYVRPEALCRLIELAARSGYNYYLPYMEHFIKLDTFRKAAPDCAYSKEDWRQFEQVGKESGIEIIPMFNVAGHTTAICRAYPELCGKTPGKEFDITLPVTKTFIAQAIEEFCSFSTSKYFLIGADEWRTPESLLLDESFHCAREYAENINRAVALLACHGKRAIMWHDMILHFPQILEYLTRDVIITFWRYEKHEGYPALGFFKKAGFTTFMGTGLRFGLLNERRVLAIREAVDESEKYGVEGFMTTTWGDTLFEPQSFNIPISARILRNESIPENLLRATGEWEYAASLLENDDMQPHQQAFYQALNDPAWREFPEYREFLTARLENNKEKQRNIYLQNHFPCGEVFERLQARDVEKSQYCLTPENSPRRDCRFFAVTVEKHDYGEKLVVLNEGETFSVYPSLSGSLQDYQHQDQVIIPKFADIYLDRKKLVPGRYDGYNEVMGLRPKFGYIDLHMPSITWSGPFEFSFDKDSEQIIIVLIRSLWHVRLKYTIRVVRGKSGFTYDVEAENTAYEAPAAWGFNLPLVFSQKGAASFRLKADDKPPLSLSEYYGNSLLYSKCKKQLTVCNDNVRLHIGINPDKIQLFHTDWSAKLNYITPDYQGKFLPLKPGEILTDSWTFSTEISTTDPAGCRP